MVFLELKQKIYVLSEIVLDKNCRSFQNELLCILTFFSYFTYYCLKKWNFGFSIVFF